MKVKAGDIVECLAISWDEFHWEFDYPTVLLLPVTQYSPNGTCPETMIEDVGIDMCVYGEAKEEDVSQEFEWRRWKLSTLKRVARERLKGKNTWKTKIREVIKQKLEFYIDDCGELTFKVIETIKA